MEAKHEARRHKLEKLLGFGKFQKFQVILFTGVASAVGAINLFQFTFLTTSQAFRCSLPEEIEGNFGVSDFTNHSDIVGQCAMQSLSREGQCSDINSIGQLIDSGCFNEDVNKTGCIYGYTHEEKEEGISNGYFWSLTAENDWVCDKEVNRGNIWLAQSIGYIFHGIIFSQLSDGWGRVPTIHITNLLFLISRFLLLVIYKNYWATLIVTGLGSAFFPVGDRASYVLIAEYTNDVGRFWLYIVSWVTWVMGVASLSVIGWASGHWYTYLIYTTLPNLFIIPFFWLSPESPRILLSQGKLEKARKIVAQIKTVNGDEFSDEKLEADLKLISEDLAHEEQIGVYGLVKSRKMLQLMFLFCITWTVNDYFYVGGQLNVENLAGNQFVNFAMVAMTEFPSVFIGQLMISFAGRRWSHVACMLLTTIFFGACALLSHDPSLSGVVTALAICAKTASNVGWFINYVQTLELIPTSSRITGINISSTISTIIGISGPYLILLSSKNLPLVYGVFALIGIVGTLATSFLPESLKQDFPECVEDVENRKKHKFFSWRVWKNNHQNKEEKEDSGNNSYETETTL